VKEQHDLADLLCLLPSTDDPLPIGVRRLASRSRLEPRLRTARPGYSRRIGLLGTYCRRSPQISLASHEARQLVEFGFQRAERDSAARYRARVFRGPDTNSCPLRNSAVFERHRCLRCGARLSPSSAASGNTRSIPLALFVQAVGELVAPLRLITSPGFHGEQGQDERAHVTRNRHSAQSLTPLATDFRTSVGQIVIRFSGSASTNHQEMCCRRRHGRGRPVNR
jgi:hypothetical protein